MRDFISALSLAKRVDLGNLFHLRRLGDDRVTLDLGDQPRLTGKQPCALVVVNGCVAAGIYEVAGKTLPGIGAPQPAGEAHGLQHREIGSIGIFAWRLYISAEEDRSELGDFDRSRRQIAKGELALKLGSNRLTDLCGRLPATSSWPMKGSDSAPDGPTE